MGFGQLSAIWQWGSMAIEPTATEAWDNEAKVEARFDGAKAAYADKSIPVIIGEYRAISRTEYDPSLKCRDHWIKTVTSSAIRPGCGFRPCAMDQAC